MIDELFFLFTGIVGTHIAELQKQAFRGIDEEALLNDAVVF